MAATWRIQPTPNPPGTTASVLDGVECASAGACTAVGGFFGGPAAQTTALALRWDGRRWALQATPTPAGTQASWLSDVSCPSANSCTAVGMGYTGHFFTYAQRWDGRRWTLQRTPHPAAATDSGLYDVSCKAPSTCTAVGNFINRAGAHLTLAERS